MPPFFTVGYGGHTPSSLVAVLHEHGVRTVLDVRIWPMRAAMGAFSMAKDPERGIGGLLGRAGVGYRWWAPLGNPWFSLGGDAWVSPYRELLARAGDLLTAGLEDVEAPWTLLCAESDPDRCHRRLVADHLAATRGWPVTHLR